MSMMNANAAATTTMTANEPLDFELPEMGDSDFSNDELAEDMDGLTMSFPRIKIPAGGVLQFEIPNGDPQHPDYRPTLTGVILYNHILAETSDAFLVRNGVEEKEITVVDNTGVPSSLMASIPQYALIQKSDYWNGVSAYTPINDAL